MLDDLAFCVHVSDGTRLSPCQGAEGAAEAGEPGPSRCGPRRSKRPKENFHPEAQVFRSNTKQSLAW